MRELTATQREVRRILAQAATSSRCAIAHWRGSMPSSCIRSPGPVLLALLLFLMFQAVFSWAQAPVAWITAGMDALRAVRCSSVMPPGPLRSLMVGGVIAGAGSVLVFLPQILILFFFILLLEDSGYLPRAAFLLDRLMGGVGLSGRSFIPLLSSFSCAIPGIMATRTIPNVQGSAGDDSAGTDDDLLGAAAGVCADHRRLHSDAGRSGRSTCRAWCCSRSMLPVWPARCWWRC